MLGQIKKKLGFPYSSELEAGFKTYSVKQRYKPLLLIVLAVALLLCLLLTWGYFLPDDLAPAPYHPTMMLIHAVFFAFTVIMLALSIALRRQVLEHPDLHMALVLIYAIAICLWGTTIAAYAVWSNVLTSAFVSVSLCLAVVVVLKPWQAIVLFFGNFTYYVILVTFVWPEHEMITANISNAALATILSVVIASVFYLFYTRTYYDQHIINKQMAQISKANRKLQEQVHIDGLTGLHNRRFYDEILPGKLYGFQKSGQSVGALMVDIDFFKQYNDHYGHLEGDDCIKAIAVAIRDVFEDEEAYAVRYGGEEFFVLVAMSGRESLIAIAERLRETVEAANIVHEGIPAGRVTISLGLAFSYDDDELVSLAGRADDELYQAKSKGRNRLAVAE